MCAKKRAVLHKRRWGMKTQTGLWRHTAWSAERRLTFSHPSPPQLGAQGEGTTCRTISYGPVWQSGKQGRSTGHFKVKVKVAQSCTTLYEPIVHGILQAKILEWEAFPFSRGSSQPRDRTQVSRIAGRFFTSWATGEAREYWSGQPIPSLADLPDPGTEPGSPALQVDSLPTEPSGKPHTLRYRQYKQRRRDPLPTFFLS